MREVLLTLLISIQAFSVELDVHFFSIGHVRTIENATPLSTLRSISSQPDKLDEELNKNEFYKELLNDVIQNDPNFKSLQEKGEPTDFGDILAYSMMPVIIEQGFKSCIQKFIADEFENFKKITLEEATLLCTCFPLSVEDKSWVHIAPAQQRSFVLSFDESNNKNSIFIKQNCDSRDAEISLSNKLCGQDSSFDHYRGPVTMQSRPGRDTRGVTRQNSATQDIDRVVEDIINKNKECTEREIYLGGFNPENSSSIAEDQKNTIENLLKEGNSENSEENPPQNNASPIPKQNKLTIKQGRCHDKCKPWQKESKKSDDSESECEDICDSNTVILPQKMWDPEDPETFGAIGGSMGMGSYGANRTQYLTHETGHWGVKATTQKYWEKRGFQLVDENKMCFSCPSGTSAQNNKCIDANGCNIIEEEWAPEVGKCLAPCYPGDIRDSLTGACGPSPCESCLSVYASKFNEYRLSQQQPQGGISSNISGGSTGGEDSSNENVGEGSGIGGSYGYAMGCTEDELMAFQQEQKMKNEQILQNLKQNIIASGVSQEVIARLEAPYELYEITAEKMKENQKWLENTCSNTELNPSTMKNCSDEAQKIMFDLYSNIPNCGESEDCPPGQVKTGQYNVCTQVGCEDCQTNSQKIFEQIALINQTIQPMGNCSQSVVAEIGNIIIQEFYNDQASMYGLCLNDPSQGQTICNPSYLNDLETEYLNRIREYLTADPICDPNA